MRTKTSQTASWKVRLTFFAALAVAAMSLVAVSGFAAPGAIYTTDATCSGVDLNIFTSKDAVYLNGGPAGGGPGLPPGNYYVRVSAPGGAGLGHSTSAVAVVNPDGNFAQCYQLSAILVKDSDLSPGYDTTTNPGGEYNVDVSMDPDFPGGSIKSDNFKVKENEIPPQGTLRVEKFYDADASGTLTAGDSPIVGWEVRVGAQADFITTYETKMTPVNIVDIAPGCYTALEGDATNWAHTNASIQSKTVVAAGTTTIEFGNVCLGGGGGMTLGFWSNKNGQALVDAGDLALLTSLNLKNGIGANFDPANYAALRTWLLNGTATNMAYMLSVQLAAMELNVNNGKVSGGAIVYAPGTGLSANGFTTINQLMAAANTDLGTPGHENTTSGTPGAIYRARQEALKNALDKANNNLNFVQSAAQCGVDPQTNVLSDVTFTYPAAYTAPACP